MTRWIAFAFGAAILTARICNAQVIGPPGKLEALRQQTSESYPFIVRLKDGASIEAAHVGLDPNREKITRLDLINGVAMTLKVSRAFELAEKPEVLQVWYLHPDLAQLYVNTIKALEYNVKTLPLPNLVNISIGPQPRFWRTIPYENEPIHAATHAAANAGLIPIIAVGNGGRADGSNDGWINPWCYPEWVICVGAYDSEKGTVADFSSRGDPKRPESWPDVVAQGVDIIGPYPTNLKKSAERKRRDESNVRFREVIAREKWDIYTIESGTSQAAAMVSGAAAQVLYFLKALIEKNQGATPGKPIFSLTAPPDRVNGYDSIKPRLTGTATHQADGSVVYDYPLDLPWKMVKQLLIDTAIPVPNAKPNAVGAGLVDRTYIEKQFGAFGIMQPQVFPSKVL